MKARIIDGPNKGETLNPSDGINVIKIAQRSGGSVDYYNTREVQDGAMMFSINEPRSTVRLRNFIEHCINDQEKAVR